MNNTPESIEIFNRVKSGFEKHKAKQTALEEIKREQEEKISHLKERENNAILAGEVVQRVARETQSHLEYHVSNLVTLALKSVSSTFPEFKAVVETRRKQTEFDLLFLEDGHSDKPLNSSGGGALDTAGFALRPTYLLLGNNRPTLILDEPFRNVSPDLQENLSEMVKKLSDKLTIQIILVSHQDGINIAADKTFIVSKVDGISQIETIDQGGLK